MKDNINNRASTEYTITTNHLLLIKVTLQKNNREKYVAMPLTGIMFRSPEFEIHVVMYTNHKKD